jgi:His-Xaa-Ser system protein HxsD
MACLPQEGAVSPVPDISEVSSPADAADGIVVMFDQATVDLDALQRSAYAVAAQMTVDIRAAGPDYACTLFPREHAPAAGELRHRFRAEVNDQILRARIGKETEPLRNLVFALAFSQTGLADSNNDGEEDAVAGA